MKDFIINGLGAILISIISSSIAVEIYKHRSKKRDKKEEEDAESSKEKIIDRRLMANELMERVRDLEKAERVLINEKIIDAKLIAKLENELQDARRFHVEQDDEIKIKYAEIMRQRDEILHLQNILTSIAKGTDITELFKLIKEQSQS